MTTTIIAVLTIAENLTTSGQGRVRLYIYIYMYIYIYIYIPQQVAQVPCQAGLGKSDGPGT